MPGLSESKAVRAHSEQKRERTHGYEQQRDGTQCLTGEHRNHRRVLLAHRDSQPDASPASVKKLIPKGCWANTNRIKKTGALLLWNEQHRRLLGRALGYLTGESLRRQNCQVKTLAADTETKI
jgi:hypothetical protein